MSTRKAGGLDAETSPGQMLTVSQTAARLQTTVRALRHYENLDLLTPLRDRRGARFYSPQLTRTASCIVEMRRLGVPVPQIATALEGLGRGCSEPIVQILAERLEALENEKRGILLLLKTFEEETPVTMRAGDD